jgi:hypothetical protein
MRKQATLLLCVLLILSLTAVYSVQAQTTPASVRDVKVESITADTVTLKYQPSVECSHFTYTFAMFKVEEWADRAYFTATVNDGKALAKWSIGFSETGGLQGIYMDSATDILQVTTVMAEFPYTTTRLSDLGDGTQNYRYYRMHFYFKPSLLKDQVVTVAADYMKDPQTGTPMTVETVSNTRADTFFVQAASTTGSVTRLRIVSEALSLGDSYEFSVFEETMPTRPTPTPTPKHNQFKWWSFLWNLLRSWMRNCRIHW